ncbi:MAG: hypothetical protein KDA28_12820, partial [Phycisphaerales bacterium]|nr:hypothetical protein [Phycisphaerales bacterium]
VRSGSSGAIPDSVPYACWLQDALGRLLDEEVGRTHHDLDFLVGMTFEALFQQYDYPRQNALRIDTTASASKFHDGPVDDDLRAAFTCDVAYVGHQSETPEDQFLRFRRELAHAPDLVRAVERLYEVLGERMLEPFPPNARDITRLVETTLLAVSGETDPKIRQQLDSMCARPMADRMLRHQTLQWVADLCDERGWSFHLHGNGWDLHPTLSRFARPTVDHGEALRACYACAGTHLHISANTSRHQRVYECFLSGGMALMRRTLADLVPIGASASAAMGEPESANTRGPGYVIADHPEAMQYIALRQRYGLGHSSQIMRPLQGGAELAPDNAWLLVDPSEVTFSTKDELASRLERCRTSPAWRASMAGAIRERVMRHCTTEAAARRVLAFLQERCQSYVP